MPQQGQYSSENANNAIISANNNTMNINSKNGKIVVTKWESFDLYENKDTNITDTVIFDGDNNSYLILVNDDKPTVIDGIIKGKANLYIVNPNGVILGSNSQVDVDNLYISTRAIDQNLINNFKSSQFPDTGTSSKGYIIALGKLNADSIYFEGNNVSLDHSDIGDIPSDKITVISGGNEDIPNLASTFSCGNVWIIAAIGAVAVVVIAAVVIAKRKKKD